MYILLQYVNINCVWNLKMCTTNQTSLNSIIVTKLSIERCQYAIAHLHALMHLCEPQDIGVEEPVATSIRVVLEAMNKELSHSYETLQLRSGC